MIGTQWMKAVAKAVDENTIHSSYFIADPAADPEVQARVLRAAAKHMTYVDEGTIEDVLTLAHSIEGGADTIQVDETPA